MAFEFDRSAALATMPKCGNCANLKLMVWTPEAKLTGVASKYAFRPFGMKTAAVLVRCNWLKSAVEQPQELPICDGWRDAAQAGSTSEKEG